MVMVIFCYWGLWIIGIKEDSLVMFFGGGKFSYFVLYMIIFIIGVN